MSARHILPSDIVSAAILVSGIDLSELWGRGRNPEVVNVRRAMVEVARRRRMSYPDLTRKILGKSTSHSSAITKHRAYQQHQNEPWRHGWEMKLCQLADLIEHRAEVIGPLSREVASAEAELRAKAEVCR